MADMVEIGNTFIGYLLISHRSAGHLNTRLADASRRSSDGRDARSVFIWQRLSLPYFNAAI